MGGKTSQSTQSVQIPPEVLARYNSVNATAQNVAQTPFQQYSTDPNAFVAPVNQQQQTGISSTNSAANEAQPFYGIGAALTGAAGPTNVGNITGQQIGQYMNPYIQSVVNPTAQLLNQQQQAQQSGQTGNAISQGAFGGDRAGIAAANLAGQQSLAFSNAINPLYSQGYNQALGTAQQQQGFDLSQQQANNQLALQQGAQFGNLGAGAQSAGLQGAQAQIGAGTLEQQTTQGGLSALYNQFQQQQSYPFQTAQFLANIAEGTGALSGSTTTTTQPSSFFSDRRLKHDIKKIGKTNDNLPIYAFKYKGDPKEQVHIGFMADEVEKKHPEAVGLSGGYKTVDYEKATEGRAMRAAGGSAAGDYTPYMGGLYGSTAASAPHGGSGYVPAATLPVSHLAVAGGLNKNNQSTATGLGQAMDLAKGSIGLYKTGKQMLTPAANQNSSNGIAPRTNADDLNQVGSGVAPPADTPAPAAGAPMNLASSGDSVVADNSIGSDAIDAFAARGGGIMPRHAYATDGSVDDSPDNLYQPPQGGLDIPNEQNKNKLQTAGNLSGQNQQSGFQNASTAIGDLSKIADLAAMFAARGGGIMPRKNYADGGAPDPDMPDPDAVETAGVVPPPTPDNVYPYVRSKAAKLGLNPDVVENVVRQEYGDGSNYSGDSSSSFGPLQLHYGNVAGGKLSHPGLGDEFTKTTGLDARDPTNWQAATDFGLQAMKKQGLTPWTTSMQKLGYSPDAAMSNNSPAASAALRLAQNTTGSQNDANPPTDPGISPAGGPLDKAGNFFTQHEDAIVPILEGLGTMASSNSRYFGSALLQGLGGGAKAYEDVKNQQANRGQTLANTGLTQAQTGTQQTVTGGNLAGIARSSIYSAGGRDFVVLANGAPMLVGQWLGIPAEKRPLPLGGAQAAAAIASSYGNGQAPAPSAPSTGNAPAAIQGRPIPAPAQPSQPTAGGQPSTAGAPANAPNPAPATTGPKYLGSAAQSYMNNDFTRLQSLPKDEFAAQKSISNNTEAAINQTATAARQQGSTLNQLSNQLMALPSTGVLAGGPLMSLKTTLIGKANDIARTFNLPALQIAPDEIGTQASADKLSKMLQFASAHNSDQNSLGALQTASAVVPSTSLSKDAAEKIIAGLYVDKQRAVDPLNYLNEYKNAVSAANPGQGDLYLAQNALTAFSNDHNDAQYGKEKEAMTQALNTTYKGQPLLNLLYEGKLSPQFVDAQVEKKFGIKNFSRYVLNN